MARNDCCLEIGRNRLLIGSIGVRFDEVRLIFRAYCCLMAGQYYYCTCDHSTVNISVVLACFIVLKRLINCF